MNIPKLFQPSLLAGIGMILVLLSSHSSPQLSHTEGERIDSTYERLTEQQKRSPRYAMTGLTVEKGLQLDLFASEPMIVNPTNIAVDHRGRVWVCEAHNYRNEITGQPPRPKGDRILILEDTNKDGKADRSTVFHQDPELNAPIGIWVLGNQVIISQSPYVWLLTDDNGDDKADRKEIIFQGIEGVHHDHGVHAFVMGPDGRYYFNFGNEGKKILDAKGNPLRGKDGKVIDFSQYKQGLVFRCDADFTNFEIIGQNFRNNYEVAIDSYGSLWQSDNDDDGNRAVRINYVMEYGNYGFTNELTGAGWRSYRTNWEDSIPNRHWHLNDPGVVPNLLHTGAGSPTGMAIYEGRLLPKVYQNQMIHTDAGPNVVRSYPVINSGAGYQATIVPIVKGSKDQWFRPTDVSVAPDGSLFFSDWYDPSVGGHQMGDATRGRIYRVVPTSHRGYHFSQLQPTTEKGALVALESPNLEARSLARKTLLKSTHQPTYQALYAKWRSSTDERLRARILWILGKHSFTDVHQLLTEASKDLNPNIRIVSIRLARQLSSSLLPSLLTTLSLDQDPQVRREVAIALRDSQFESEKKASIWINLARQYDGKDRWYLEALGIAAEGHWDFYYKKWLETTPRPLMNKAESDIVWRARTVLALPYLQDLASDPTIPLGSRLRYFRSFDFIPGDEEKSEVLMKLLSTSKADTMLQSLVLHHLPSSFIAKNTQAKAILQQQLDQAKGSKRFIDLIKKYQLQDQQEELLQLLLANGGNDIGRASAVQLLQGKDGDKLLRPYFLDNKEESLAKIIPSLRSVGSNLSVQLLETVILSNQYSMSTRKQALLALGGSMIGEDRIVQYLAEGRLPEELKSTSLDAVKNAWRKSIRMEVERYLEKGLVLETKTKHPPVQELIVKEGNPQNGKKVFDLYCTACHQVNQTGSSFGPPLTEIGDKLPKQGHYLALFSPNAGISFGYEGSEIQLLDGSKLVGIIVSKTANAIEMKFPGGATQEILMDRVQSITPSKESLMTAGLAEAMSTEQLVDLVEYLVSLKSKK